MKTYEFELKFSLSKASQNPGAFVERLAEAGCTDALVGIGQTGRIAFHFARDAHSAFTHSRRQDCTLAFIQYPHLGKGKKSISD